MKKIVTTCVLMALMFSGCASILSSTNDGYAKTGERSYIEQETDTLKAKTVETINIEVYKTKGAIDEAKNNFLEKIGLIN